MDYHIEYFKSVDGASVAGARAGRGAPLLLSPSFGSTIETDLAIYAAAFPDRELFTWDRRGWGLSERDAPCSEREPYFQDAQAVVDGFGLDAFAVVGTLWGTVEAAWVAANNAERVAQLVLRLPMPAVSAWASIPGVAAGLAALEHDWEYYTESFASFIVGWGNPAGPRLAAKFRAITSQAELKAMFGAFIDLDLEPLYRRIEAATLVEHNPQYFFPDSYSRRVASLIDNCHLTIYTGAGSEFMTDFALAEDFLAGARMGGIPDAPGPKTIMFTDLESSTALTQRLGDDAAQELIRQHDATVRAALAGHRGREVKHTGDGIMASFSSAVAAVGAALQIQRDVADSQIGVRVGLNAGEPIVEGGDLFGTAVQLAARITDRAEPGEVLVSNVVRELCAGKQFSFEPRGDATLKGFTDPVALYAVST